MRKNFGLLLVVVMIFMTFFITACKEPSEPARKPPQSKITIEFLLPSESVVKGGADTLFAVFIEASDNKPGGVNWELVDYNGGISSITKDPDNETIATLRVPKEEQAESLKIKATSARDPKVSAEVTVRLDNFPPPVVFDVEITYPEQLEDLKVKRGGSLYFIAVVKEERGDSTELTWHVSGNLDNETTISSDGFLYVGENETAAVITVTAKALLDPTKYAEVQVTVLSPPTVRSVRIEPETTTVVRGGEQEFSYYPVDYDEGAAINEVDWIVTGNSCEESCTETTGITAGILTVCAHEKASFITVTVRARTNHQAAASATVEILKQFSISINPLIATFAAPGASISFERSGSSAGTEPVTWEVTGGSNSTIDPDGTLTVGANETAATLSVRAKSVNFSDIVSDPIEVTVIHKIYYATRASVSNWDLPGTLMEKRNDGTFIIQNVDITEPTIFSFNFNGETAAENVEWFGSDDIASIGNIDPLGNNIVYFKGEVRPWRIVTPGFYEMIISPHEMTLAVENLGIPRLDTPEKPWFKDPVTAPGVVEWQPLSNETYVTEYVLRLYRGVQNVHEVEVAKGTYTYSFLDDMRDTGIYTVTVRAVGDNNIRSPSNPSDACEPQTVRHRSAVTGLNWNGSTARWNEVNGVDHTAMGYTVNLYRGESQIKSYTVTQTEKDFTSDISGINGSYSFSVIALGDYNTLIRDSEDAVQSERDFKLFNVWFFDILKGTRIPMASENGIFIWNKDKANNFTEETRFKFALSDSMSVNDFFVPAETRLYTQGIYDMIHSTSQYTNEWHVIPGVYILKLEKTAAVSNHWQVRIERPVEVTGGDFESHAAVNRGETHTFAPKLTGVNAYDALIRWTVTGANAVTSSFGGSGATRDVLTVGASEANTQLTITLYAKGDDGNEKLIAAKTVIVRNQPQEGNVTINLTIQRHDGDFVLAGLQGGTPSISKSNDDQITLTVTPQTGQSDFKWKVDDKTPVTGLSITLRAMEYTLGTHTVLLYATIDGIVWSLDPIKFTVIQ